MKKTDIGVVAFMYLVCGYFYYHMTKLKASSQTARPIPALPSSFCSG